MQRNKAMVRSTRASFACARCYKRKKKCDRGYPSCSQCTRAKAQCIGLDRNSEEELPRSLVTYLQDLVTQLELERQRSASQSGPGDGDPLAIAYPDAGQLHRSPADPAGGSMAYALATKTAEQSAPAIFLNKPSQVVLPYYKTFFMGAELPYPLAFQDNRTINLPPRNDALDFTKLPIEVADKLIAVYTERILPQHPLFLKEEIFDMYHRHKDGQATPNEKFIIFMIKAITTLSSNSRDYRKVVSLSESLRRDAFNCLDFGLDSNKSSTSTLQQLILLAQYGWLLPSSTNLWHIVGDATKIALELGLHHEVPKQAGLSEAEIENRKRLFWTLYCVERSVAITSHRPFSIAGDEIHVGFPTFNDTTDPSDMVYDQGSYVRFMDRVQFFKVQSEICSVNIGMRPIFSPGSSYEEWVRGIERRIAGIQTQATMPKSCDLLEWQSIILLHMPCRRNPNPSEASVTAYFNAAVRVVDLYWELAQVDRIDNPWHAVHHCYEAGNLILYSLCHFAALIRKHYTMRQVFETVHQVSSFFILIVKQWPAANQCVLLFDELRKGALSAFREDASPTEESTSLAAQQLKELVFRENADFLYARDQLLSTDSTTNTAVFPGFEMQDFTMGFVEDLSFLDFLSFPASPDHDVLNEISLSESLMDAETSDLTIFVEGSDDMSLEKSPIYNLDEARLRTVLQRLPVCSRCKRRRIKCDMALPSCRNCTKHQVECLFWDNALSHEISRKQIETLQDRLETLMKDSRASNEALEHLVHDSNLATGTMHPISWDEGHRLFTSNATANILCRLQTAQIESGDTIFFGQTSSFARLASQVGPTLPTPKEMLFRPPRDGLSQRILDSLQLHSASDIPKSVAEDLALLYYRSIELSFPILGRPHIRLILDHVYDGDSLIENSSATRTRFDLILAISLALLSRNDERLCLAADTYFRNALVSGLSDDHFVHPTNTSLQLVLLLCVYAWIFPGALDVWRLIGHASRMCLDIIELHGSDKSHSPDAGMLYRTLYALEAQISIAFGRPFHLPDGTDIPVSSPDPSLMSGDELSTLVYNLARLQSRFHKDIIGRDYDPSHMQLIEGPSLDLSWMRSYVNDMKSWLEEWRSRVDSLFVNSPSLQLEEDITRPLKLWGQFQQSQALLLAKVVTQHRGQTLISNEEELAICKQLLEAADWMLRPSRADGFTSSSETPFAFPYTWTQAHSIFDATTVIMQHIKVNNGLVEQELENYYRMGLRVLRTAGGREGSHTSGLVTCLENMYQEIRPPVG